MVDVTVERAGQSVTVLPCLLVLELESFHSMEYLRCAAGDRDNISDIKGGSSGNNGGQEGSGDD